MAWFIISWNSILFWIMFLIISSLLRHRKCQVIESTKVSCSDFLIRKSSISFLEDRFQCSLGSLLKLLMGTPESMLSSFGLSFTSCTLPLLYKGNICIFWKIVFLNVQFFEFFLLFQMFFVSGLYFFCLVLFKNENTYSSGRTNQWAIFDNI